MLFRIPGRSRLIGLPPMGLGTAFSESLTSYIIRLSAVHVVRVGTLMSREILPTINEHCERNFNVSETRKHVHTINGINKQAENFTTSLTVLTKRQDLKHLTFLTWTDVLDQAGLLRLTKAWCPMCFQAFKKPEEIYEPLLWSFKAVKVCPVHGINLVDVCPHCDQQLLHLANRAIPGFCYRCNGWLGKTPAITPDSVISEFEVWSANQLGQLIALIPSLAELPKKENLARSLERIVAQIPKRSLTRLVRTVGLDGTKIWRMKNGSTCTLENLLRLCYLFGIPLTSFLLSQEFTVDLKQPKNLSKEHRIGSRQSKIFNMRDVKVILTNALANPECPSIMAISREFGVPEGTLRSKYPEMCREISANSIEKRKLEKMRRIDSECVEVEEAVIKLLQAGTYPSQKKVGPLLSKKGMLMGKEQRQTLNRLVQRHLGKED